MESDLSDGQSALKGALNTGQIGVALYLVNHCGIGGDSEVRQALCKVCEVGPLDDVKELIEVHNVDPTGTDHVICQDHDSTL